MDAEIVTRGSRIPKICALCVFILAVFFYVVLSLRRFFQRCGLCARGSARRGRRSSRSGESPVVCARAAAFVIRFYIRAGVHTVLRRIVRSLRGTARLCLGSGAYSRNFGCRTALRFVCFFNGVKPRRICGRDRRSGIRSSFRYMLSAKTPRAGSSFHTRECFCVCRVCATFVYTAAALISHFLR